MPGNIPRRRAHRRNRHLVLMSLRPSDVKHVLATLAEHAPLIFLDHALPGDANGIEVTTGRYGRPGPLSHVPAGALIEWCGEDHERWIRVAQRINPFDNERSDYENPFDDEVGSISQLAVAFLDAAPHSEEVIEAYLGSVVPMVWSGSRAHIMERRLAALEALAEHRPLVVRRTIDRLAPDIRMRIDRISAQEQGEDQELNHGFE